MSDWVVRVPASSANLGAGYDVLGLALTLHAYVGVGDAPPGIPMASETHPATVAYRRAGGVSPLWVRSPIPAGRGLGFSGSMRVGGAVAALVEQYGTEALADAEHRSAALAIAVELEQHADNAAPSLHGGLVIVADDQPIRVPLGFDPVVVAWVPFEASTSTNSSRAALAPTVSREDAVFNMSRVASFVAACATGDTSLLAMATEDRLHQPTRLAAQPESSAALEAALEAGASAAWLSGSGPTVAAFCDSATADAVAAALPASGHAKQLRIDTSGACIVGHREVPTS